VNELYIDTSQALTRFCQELSASRWIALDTEFIRESTYYPKLCLIQIADQEHAACIDPLAVDDLSPVLEILYRPDITKVLHSAHQDLEIFFNLRGSVPAPIFDTQIAATLLGCGEQIGYAALVKLLLGVELDKSQTRTDWSRRPLETRQIRYALDDVLFLRQVYCHQLAELHQRQEWLKDDFQALSESSRYQTRPDEAWQRIKGAQHLRGVQLAVLRALAAWRETRARAVNRPRKWIVGDDGLLELARNMPLTAEGLERTQGINAATTKRHGQTLVEVITAARNEPQEHWPTPPPPRRHVLSPTQEALVDIMMAIVRLRGSEIGIKPETLASRKDLERLATNQDCAHLFQGWRAAVAGREIDGLVRGTLHLEVRGGEIRTAPVTGGSDRVQPNSNERNPPRVQK
jgi:ribonuclease D